MIVDIFLIVSYFACTYFLGYFVFFEMNNGSNRASAITTLLLFLFVFLFVRYLGKNFSIIDSIGWAIFNPTLFFYMFWKLKKIKNG